MPSSDFVTLAFTCICISLGPFIFIVQDGILSEPSFFIGFPSGSKYTIWTGNVTVNDGDFSYNSVIDAKGNVIIYGQVTLPAGYDINDYLSPSITNIQVS